MVLLALLFLVPMVGSVRDFLHELPETIEQLRASDELVLARRHRGRRERCRKARRQVSRRRCRTRSPPCSASPATSSRVFLAGFTILFICLFFLSDVGNLKRALASVLMPGEDERWLGVWERVTESVSRWAIGVVVIATIAGTTQGVTAWLLGSSFALALGVIAGLLDMIPNIGATIAGFILVPALWAEEGLTAAADHAHRRARLPAGREQRPHSQDPGQGGQPLGFFIIVAVTLFGALLGVLGALTAVPLAATIQIFVQELTKARREKCRRPPRVR